MPAVRQRQNKNSQKLTLCLDLDKFWFISNNCLQCHLCILHYVTAVDNSLGNDFHLVQTLYTEGRFKCIYGKMNSLQFAPISFDYGISSIIKQSLLIHQNKQENEKKNKAKNVIHYSTEEFTALNVQES